MEQRQPKWGSPNRQEAKHDVTGQRVVDIAGKEVDVGVVCGVTIVLQKDIGWSVTDMIHYEAQIQLFTLQLFSYRRKLPFLCRGVAKTARAV